MTGSSSANHIFISYKREEYEFALSLATQLRNFGINIWMDRLDIRVGDNWSQSLREAINNCVGLVAILTPEYFTSKYCPNELTRAYNMGRPIFPIILRPLPKEQIPLELELSQYIDFSNFEDSKAFQERFTELMNSVKAKASQVVGTKPDLETQYLNTLISELEKRSGVLEYVELETHWVSETRPDPRLYGGWDPEFGLLRQQGENNDSSTPELVRTNIREAVHDNPQFVLTGEPGTGKTTTIRRLASEMAKARLENPISSLPLFIYLPEWTAPITPLEFVKLKFPLSTIDLQSALIKGDTHLFLDGLNEMGEDGTSKAVQLKDWLSSSTKPRNCIITCRTSDYVGGLNLNLPTVDCRPLDEIRIKEFIGHYLNAEQAEIMLNILLPKLTDERFSGLIELAQNPYLLAALIFLFRETGSRELPRNAGSLFKQLSRVLWKRELTRKTSGWIPFEQAEATFARLAYAMIHDTKPVDVPISWALAQIANITTFLPQFIFKLLPRYDKLRSLVNVGRSATLLDVRGANGQPQTVRFFHQLTQEYFAGVALLKNGFEQKLVKPQFREYRRVAQKWDQVIVAGCGLVSDPDPYIGDVAAVDPFLAADCIASLSKQPPKATTFVVNMLREMWVNASLDENLSLAITRTLGRLGNEVTDEDIRRRRELATSKDPGKKHKPTSKVFISYKRSDSASLAQFVSSRLKDEGFDVFLDVSSIRPGESFAQIIQKAIEQTDIFLVFLGKSALNSDWVDRELEYAFKMNKLIIPIFQDGFDRTIVEDHPMLNRLLDYQGIQIDDRSNRYIDASIYQLIQAIYNSRK